MNFTHNLGILVYALPTWHVVLVELKRMGVVHYHPAHSFVYFLLRIVPKTHVNRAVILDVSLIQINSLLYCFAFIIFLAGADQVEAVHIALAFAKPLVTHFKLHFVPKTILVVSCQCVLRVCEFRRKGSKINKIRMLALNSLFLGVIEICLFVHVIKLSVYLLVNGLVYLDILFFEKLLVVVVDVVHYMLVHFHHLLVKVTIY